MVSISDCVVAAKRRIPRDNGRLIGPKAPLELPEIWAIRIRLQLAN
jgi:hypothetical protein